MYGLISIFSFVFIFFSIIQYKNMRLNSYRDRLFALRHELMCLTFSTQLSCDDEIYRYYEDKINSHIRFAHTVSFFKIIVYRYYIKRNKVDLSCNREFENYQLVLLDNKDLENKIKEIDGKMGDAFIVYLLTTSFMIWFYIFYRILTKTNIKDGKIDLGVKEKIDETIDIFEDKDFECIWC